MALVEVALQVVPVVVALQVVLAVVALQVVLAVVAPQVAPRVLAVVAPQVAPRVLAVVAPQVAPRVLVDQRREDHLMVQRKVALLAVLKGLKEKALQINHNRPDSCSACFKTVPITEGSLAI